MIQPSEDDLKKGYERYEKLRLVSPAGFIALYDANIKQHINFDDIVDCLDRKKIDVKAAIEKAAQLKLKRQQNNSEF